MKWHAGQLLGQNAFKRSTGYSTSLSTDADITSFTKFILGDPKSRIPHIRNLVLTRDASDDPITPHIGRLLAKLFRHFVSQGRLCDLTITHAEAFLRSDLELAPTISRLGTLESLTITSAGVQCFHLLRTLRSSLVELSICVSTGTTGDPLDDALDGVLIPSRLTLQKMRLAGWHFPWPYGVSFPSVTFLSLRHIVDAQLPDYLRAFPGLQEFRMSRSSTFLAEERYDDGHRAQLHALTIGSIRRPWSSLECFVGRASAIIILPPFHRRGVPFLSLWEDKIERAHEISSALRSVKPTHLELRLTGGRWLLDGGILAGICREGSLENLQSLSISVSSRESEEDLDLVSALDNIARRVLPKLCSLTSFDLHISGSWEYIEFNLDPCDNHEIGENWTLNSVSQRLLDVGESESLRSVGVSLDCPQLGDIPPARVGYPYTPAFKCEADEHELNEDSEDGGYSIDGTDETEGGYDLADEGQYDHMGDGEEGN
ncbi:hypothetical protein C8Q78DRAFT_1082731 [Trametes maxima]|nr:hypothetical protein C8Q78DRAFT_1082731 [Trametes maxima]